MVLAHAPFAPTPHSRDRDSTDEQRDFEDMVTYTDFIVGLFQDQRESLGLLRDAVFVFTADNGAHHKLVSELQKLTIRAGKSAPTDAGPHLPLIVNAPGRIPGGRVLDDLIDSADFLPTLAEAAGLTLPVQAGVDGRSFWDQLSGKTCHPREWLYVYLLSASVRRGVQQPVCTPGSALRAGQAVQVVREWRVVRSSCRFQ